MRVALDARSLLLLKLLGLAPGLDLPLLVLVLVQAASPMMALRRDLPAPSPSTTWESSTPVAPPSTETPHHGVPPRLMPTTTTSPELVPGDTAMPLALEERLV